MTGSEIDSVVHTANSPKQALAVGFALGYLQARSVKPDMELFSQVYASAPELATSEGREALTKVIDEWMPEKDQLAAKTAPAINKQRNSLV